MEIKTNALKAIALFAATKDIRYYLKGVHLKTTGGLLRLTASDGYTMATYTAWAAETPDLECIIPIESVSLAIKAAGKAQGIEVMHSAEFNHWTIAGIPFQPIEGNYPNARRVWETYADGTKQPDGKPCLIDPEFYSRIGKAAKVMGVKFESISVWYDTRALLFQIDTDLRGIVMPLRTDLINPGAAPAY